MAVTLAQVAAAIPIAILPWFFGGVQSSVQVWLSMGLVAAALCVLFSVRHESERVQLPPATVPLLIAVALGVFQIVPLPPSVIQAIAPTNATLWQQQLGEWGRDQTGSGSHVRAVAGELERRPGDRFTVSLYPASTRRDLALLVTAVLVFIIGASCFWRPTAVFGLLLLAAVNGAALSFWGLIMQLRPVSALLAEATVRHAGSPFATFVNKNHAAAYLNLALAAALGLAIWSFAKTDGADGSIDAAGLRPRHKRTAAGSFQRLWHSGRALVAQITGWQIFALALITLISAGILCTTSRGSWVAALSATVVTAGCIWIAKRSDGRLVMLAGAATLGLALVVWLGRGELIGHRLASLASQIQNPDGRLSHWKDGLATAGDFWPLGSGLGTYRYVYLLHDTTSGGAWYYHAENQYLESLVEGGWLGLLLIVVLVSLVGQACYRLLAEPAGSLRYALGAAVLFALTTQVVHSVFDFGLYLPANMALFALMMGSACGLTAQLASRRQRQSGVDRRRAGIERDSNRIASRFRSAMLTIPLNKTSWAICASIMLMAAVAAGVETWRAAQAEYAVKRAGIAELSQRLPADSDLKNSLASLEQAIELQPDNAETQQSLAAAWMTSCRSQLVATWQKNATGPVDIDALWRQSAPLELHARAAALIREGRLAELEALQKSPAVVSDLTQAARHLLMARRCCPILPETHLLLAELAPLVSVGDEKGHLSRMRAIVNTDDRLLLESGLVESQSGRVEQTLADWQRVIARSPGQLAPLLTYAAAQLHFSPEQIEKLLPDDASLLVDAARQQLGAPESLMIRTSLLKRAGEVLASAKPSPERHYLQGVVLALEENHAAAAQELSQAVKLSPEKLNWRYELAMELHKSGELEAAYEQADLCLTQEPNNERYEQLFRQLVRSRITSR